MTSQSADRLMSIVESFLKTPQPTLSQVAAACGMGSPTAMRYLRQLVERGWLERDETSKCYTLGVALATIGQAAQAAQPMRVRALPYMQELLQEFGETVNIAMKHQGEVVVVEALEGNQSIRRGAKVGEKDEWFNSSLGKAILAHMPEEEVLHLLELWTPQQRTEKTLVTKEDVFADLALVYHRGYALDDEESEVGLKCVGVPVWGGISDVNYAISVSGPTQRINNRLGEIIARLKSAAAEISQAAKGEV